MAVHAFNSNTREAEQRQMALVVFRVEFQERQGYTENSHLKKQNEMGWGEEGHLEASLLLLQATEVSIKYLEAS